MDDIRDIVQSIVRGCKQSGKEVSEILAAFVARTIVETNASSFALDGRVTHEKVENVVLQSITRLLENDNPALEMIKMQVDYDSVYLKEDNDAQKKLRQRNKAVVLQKDTIMEIHMEDANDFEALTTLYRKIFKFLLDFAPNSKNIDRAVEREVAAALESVFPRVGLKSFILLSTDEKTAQLLELARIILGIRLFNREEGRGGAGIDNMDKDSNILANVLLQDIDREVEFFTDACYKYERAIVNAHVQRRKKKFEEREEITHIDDEEEDSIKAAERIAAAEEALELAREGKIQQNLALVSDYVIDRWSQELGNRRQYLGFLKSLQVEAVDMQEKISNLCDKIKIELVNVKALVSNKTSVPKELVYPRFDALGQLWLTLYEEVVTIIARSNTFQTLCKYRLSFNPTLVDTYIDDPMQSLGGGDLENQAAEVSGMNGESKDERQKFEDSFSMAESVSDSPDAERKVKKQSSAADELVFDEVNAQGATLLSVQNTPDFVLLPLELQGYCPWTIVEARGLLMPGKPALGIVRYDNLYYVCDHIVAIRAFMANPEKYLAKIRNRALKNPEFIHLLRLQRWFPNASISRLLKQQELTMTDPDNQPRRKDASTGTPIHFNEGYIDVNYHWNEWELRRRALKIVNLKKCQTQGQQTDESHFRRDNESQVYEVRGKGTQTKRDKGTNPPIVTTYVEGLRGMVAATKVAGEMEGVGRLEEEEERGGGGRGEGKESAEGADDAGSNPESSSLRASRAEGKSVDGMDLEGVTERSLDEFESVSEHPKSSEDLKAGAFAKAKELRSAKTLVHPRVGVVTLTLDL